MKGVIKSVNARGLQRGRVETGALEKTDQGEQPPGQVVKKGTLKRVGNWCGGARLLFGKLLGEKEVQRGGLNKEVEDWKVGGRQSQPLLDRRRHWGGGKKGRASDKRKAWGPDRIKVEYRRKKKVKSRKAGPDGGQ